MSKARHNHSSDKVAHSIRMHAPRPLIKGTLRGIIWSVLIHAGLVLLATGIIIFILPKNTAKKFIPPPAINPLKMPLKKILVPLRKSSKPKTLEKITSTRSPIAFNAISLSDLSVGNLISMKNWEKGDLNFIEIPPINDQQIFGIHETTGNDFCGRLYDMKRWRDGRFNYIRNEELKRGVPDTFRTEIYHYIEQGWKESIIAKYYRSKKLYTTHFCFPAIPATMAADQFGVPETEGYSFFLKYQGALVFPRDITFRFWCSANSFGMVQVNGKEILVAGWEMHVKFFDWWEPVESVWKTQYVLSDRWMAPSDWITLKAGVPVPMKVLIGNRGHNAMSFILLVEEKGVKYPSRNIGGPLLPIFKTEELSQDMLDQIMNFLPEGEANLTNGPIFKAAAY